MIRYLSHDLGISVKPSHLVGGVLLMLGYGLFCVGLLTW